MQVRILLDDDALYLPAVSSEELGTLLTCLTGALHQRKASYPRNGWTTLTEEPSLQILLSTPAAEELVDE